MKALRIVSRFGKDQRGAVGLIFGLSIIPMMGLVGAAVDYSRGAAARNQLQSASDAAALALAKDSVRATSAEAYAHAQAVFNANWADRGGTTIESFTVTKGVDRYRVEARARMPFSIMPLLGFESAELKAVSVSGWGVKKIEIALVLDNTGSMGWSNKMPELKKALCGDAACANSNPNKGFIRMMKDAANEDDQIRVALVPFDTTVRVPLGIQGTVNASTLQTSSFNMSGPGYCGSNPTNARRNLWVRFADRDKNTLGGQWVWTQSGWVWQDQSCEMAMRPTQSNWLGCLWDRDQTGNRDTIGGGADPALVETLYPAVACRSNNLARMASLVNVKTNVASLVSSLAAMEPSGNTNLTIGVAWGTNMLTPGAPLSNSGTDPNIKRYMILLTDGENTENRQTTNSTLIDARARLACDAAKAQDIEIFAIRVIEGNRALLQNCATRPENYREVSAASQIEEVFRSIASQIGGIRITS